MTEPWECEEGNIQYEVLDLGSFLKSLISISRNPCRIVGLRFLFAEAGLARRIAVGAVPGHSLTAPCRFGADGSCR